MKKTKNSVRMEFVRKKRKNVFLIELYITYKRPEVVSVFVSMTSFVLSNSLLRSLSIFSVTPRVFTAAMLVKGL